MTKLENVSTIQLIECLNRLKYQDKTYTYIYEFLINNNITDYQALKDILNSMNVNNEFAIKYLKRELSLVEEKVSKSNMLGKEPKIYTFDIYKDCNIDSETLRITDESNYGDILIPPTLFKNTSSKSIQLKNLTINEIKHISSHLSRYRLKNSLMDKPNFGTVSVENVIKRINFYEEQVIRQAKETNKRGINLFMLNKQEKDEIVKSQLEDIINYILNNNSNNIYMWGSLTEEQKNKMIRIITSPLSKNVRKDKENFIDIISNYTTMSELEEGIIKNKTLNRFLAK